MPCHVTWYKLVKLSTIKRDNKLNFPYGWYYLKLYAIYLDIIYKLLRPIIINILSFNIFYKLLQTIFYVMIIMWRFILVVLFCWSSVLLMPGTSSWKTPWRIWRTTWPISALDCASCLETRQSHSSCNRICGWEAW